MLREIDDGMVSPLGGKPSGELYCVVIFIAMHACGAASAMTYVVEGTRAGHSIQLPQQAKPDLRAKASATRRKQA